MPIRIVLADDHPIVLEGLAQLFAAEPGFDVVARVTNGDEALASVRKHRPDVLILDLRMPGKDGMEVLREMRRAALPTRIVVLTAMDSSDLLQAIRLGVQGVVLKDMATQLLVRAVREVHAGGKWIEKGIATRALDTLLDREGAAEGFGDTLTPREIEVARLTAKGHPNKIVAETLSITEGTVKLHLHHVYEKLHLDGRMALVRYLQGRGLL